MPTCYNLIYASFVANCLRTIIITSSNQRLWECGWRWNFNLCLMLKSTFFSSTTGVLQTHYQCQSTGAHFSKAPETFWARKAIFSSSVSKNGVYMPETSYSKGTSVLTKNTRIKQPFEILLHGALSFRVFQGSSPTSLYKLCCVTPPVSVDSIVE